MIIKLPKTFLERVKTQTEADRELQLKLQRQAPTCGNALLAAGIHIFGVRSNKELFDQKTIGVESVLPKKANVLASPFKFSKANRFQRQE